MSTSIKGGGRAAISQTSEQLITALLYDIHHQKNKKQIQSNKYKDHNHDISQSSVLLFNEMKPHDQKKEGKRFLKKLVEVHNRRKLVRKLNGISIDHMNICDEEGGNPEHHRKYETLSTLSSSEHSNKNPSIQSTTNTIPTSGNVRLNIIEAIELATNSTTPSSSKKSNDKPSQKKDKTKTIDKLKSTTATEITAGTRTYSWKKGPTQKTIVIPRSTTIQDLYTICQNKLQMKKSKKQCNSRGSSQTKMRIFYVDVKTNLEIDLLHDVAALEDGILLHVGYFQMLENQSTNATTAKISSSSKEDDEISNPESNIETILEESKLANDPLESIKIAYDRKRKQREGRSHRHHYRNSESNHESNNEISTNNVSPSVNHNNTTKIEKKELFKNCLDQLEPLPQSRADLPAALYRDIILSSLDTSRVLIICGATGCGKSTQVPQYILEGMVAKGCHDSANIIVTQPRRVAAISLAMRVAEERKSPPPGKTGSTVGYIVRLKKASSSSMKICYCTVGVLLRMLVNPGDNEIDLNRNNIMNDEKTNITNIPLQSVSHVVIDEVHERDLNTDFVLTLLRPLLALNKDLKIILMSATTSTGLFMSYFRNYKCPETSNNCDFNPVILEIPGRTFPVNTFYLDDCEKLISCRINENHNEQSDHEQIVPNNVRSRNNYTDEESKEWFSPRAGAKIDNDFIIKLILKLMDEKINGGDEGIKNSGSIMVFLPGKGEIDSLSRCMFKDSCLGNRQKFVILPLYSSLPPSEQFLIFQPPQYGKTKIILTTNVAETSITIPDVSVVIDTGRVKESRFNPVTRISELVTVWTSQASAKQRCGRAGRTGPGRCFKLYHKRFEENLMSVQTSPEILRTPLDSLVLQICLLSEHKSSDKECNKGYSPSDFLVNAPEPPSMNRVKLACNHLFEIGALNEVDQDIVRLTPLGYHMAHLPMDPKVAKILIVGSTLGCLKPALTIAATLSCTKSCWITSSNSESRLKASECHENIILNGFGGPSWSGGTVKGDLIAIIAAFNAWIESSSNHKDRRKFAQNNYLDQNALEEIRGLRTQFKESLALAGLLDDFDCDDERIIKDFRTEVETKIEYNNDALLTCCCLVAGLYPNIATLIRPSREKKIRFARLLTKDGDLCRPSSSSFQCNRVKNASESGKDAYAVYHDKHRTTGTSKNTVSTTQPKSPGIVQSDCFLSEINFVPTFSLLLFGGEIEVRDNYLVVDNWLKFKVGDKGQRSAVLIQELRKELDNILVKRFMMCGYDAHEKEFVKEECCRIISVVRSLLSDD